jgi:BirA family transcriptional regulator, biotin operon repressor / biotin---[acetyl-CoA-carboxylase] ligase
MDLEPARIERELARLGASIGRPLSVAAETTSTNDDARRAAAAGAPHGAAFLADAQTAGRGRGGHAWHSPPGENLYLSIVLRPAVAATGLATITLAVGAAVLRVVRRALGGRAEVALKWPNDVFVDGRKIAGILVEGQLRGDRVASVVAGIGLNVRTRSFPPELARRATSLVLAGAVDPDRASSAAALLAEVGSVTSMHEAAGLAPLLAEIRAADFLRGRALEVAGLRGVGDGIDDAGRLLVRDAAGDVHAVASGEVLLEGMVDGCWIDDRSSP